MVNGAFQKQGLLASVQHRGTQQIKYFINLFVWPTTKLVNWTEYGAEFAPNCFIKIQQTLNRIKLGFKKHLLNGIMSASLNFEILLNFLPNPYAAGTPT